MNLLYIEGAAGLIAAGVAAPIVIQMRARSKPVQGTMSARSVRPQFEGDDLRVAVVQTQSKPSKEEKEKKVKPEKKSGKSGWFSFKKSPVASAPFEVDEDDMAAPAESDRKEIQTKEKTTKKTGFFGFSIGKKTAKTTSPMMTDDMDENESLAPHGMVADTSARVEENQQNTTDDDDDLVLLSTPSHAESTAVPTSLLKQQEQNVTNSHYEDDELIEIPRMADHEDDLTVSIPTPQNVPKMEIDDEDSEVGFVLRKTAEDEQRQRWIEEAAELQRNSGDEEHHVETIVHQDDHEHVNGDKESSIRETNSREHGDDLYDIIEPSPQDTSQILTSYQWTTFMGMDAQSLGPAERENLILLLRNMRDPSHFDILTAAFEEEKSDGLRPKVLEALIHSYHDPVLVGIYDYCTEYGNDEEKELAKNALDRIAAA